LIHSDELLTKVSFLRLDRPGLNATAADLIPMSVQNEPKVRWIPGCWRNASEAHIRGDLQRASNEPSTPEDKRIRLILNAHWN
jgi:hypothetical protein